MDLFMEKFIEVNGNWLFSDEHFLLTERGWLKAKELQNGDKVIGVKGKSTVNYSATEVTELRKGLKFTRQSPRNWN